MDKRKESFCFTEFWNLNATWYAEIPDFTQCFQNSVLVFVPCGCFLLAAVLSFWRTSKFAFKNPLPWTLLFISKLVLCIGLLAVSLTELGIAAHRRLNGENIPDVIFYSSSVKAITFVFVLIMVCQHKCYGKRTSNILSLFWLVLTVCSAITFRSTFLHASFENFAPITEDRFVLNILYFSLIIGEFLLSFFKDAKPLEGYKELSPFDEAPLFSFLTFHWINSLVIQSTKKLLTIGDFPPLTPELKAANLFAKFKTYWMRNIKSSDRVYIFQEDTSKEISVKPTKSKSLAWTVMKCFWPWILCAVVLELTYDVVRLFPSLLLDVTITFMNSNDPQWKGYLFCFAMFLSPFITTLAVTHLIYFALLSAMQIKSALTSAIYQKSLSLSNSSKQQYTTGELMNLMAVDADMIFNFAQLGPLLFGAPLRVILAFALIWQYIGPSCLAGLVVIVLMIPLTTLYSKKSHIIQGKQMSEKDTRLKHMSEILSGIKVLKLYAWEIPFIRKIEGIRNQEVKLIKLYQFYHAGFSFIWNCAPFLVTLASFVTYVLVDENHILDPSKAFVSLTLFNSMKSNLVMMPQMLSLLIKSNISLGRVRKFLSCEEIDQNAVGNSPDEGEDISMHEATLSWKINEEPTLKRISFHAPKRSLIAVVGQVGSGKSTLLNALLGDMVKLSGTVDMKGKIAYVPQQAWIQNDTLKQNILFVRQMHEQFYNQVLECCCLKPDLEILPGGDMTEIGEKGINLSGGQKHRVSLARAVYQEADVYLLDDPLSAVDAHVGKALFENVIGPKGLLKKKTRILVTNNISILPYVDNIVTMKDGEIEETGTYDELMNRKGPFSAFIIEHLKKQETADSDSEINEEESMNVLHYRQQSITKDVESPDYIRSLSHAGKSTSRQLSHSVKRTSAEAISKPSSALIEEEKMEVGKVKRSVYLSYLKHASYYLIFIFTFCYVVYQALQIGANVWLSKWSSDPPLPDGTQNIPLRNMRIGIYGVFGLGQGIFIVFAAFALAIGAAKAARCIHHEMLHSIMRSPMSFFDTTPTGRILNRFGKDIDVVDSQIPSIMEFWMTFAVAGIGSFIIVGINVPLFFAFLVPIVLISYFVQKLYLIASRQIKRLESTARSPVYSHFSESIQGATSIRAYNVQNEFVKRAYNKIDAMLSCSFYGEAVNRWLGFRLDLIGCFVILIAAILAVAKKGILESSVAGLILSYALSVTDSITYWITMNANLETKIVSVERIDEYSKLDSELPWKTDDGNSPPTAWPTSGDVSFKDYSVRYREELDLALKKINLNIISNEKVGIVGRTGAGKSSLTLALFRIIEPAGGSIIIDGINVSNIGLHDLRQKLTIIPQDPVLFTGTLRTNLDPNDNYTDEELWISLEHAHLKNYILSLKGGLMYEVDEGGENLSVGQRQLICFARALLKKSKILILDEATAAVDMETDRLIQNTIRTEFNHCTIITIAHRLHTIMDYEKVVVMSEGRISEVGSPSELIQNPDSMFHLLAKDAGLV